MAAAVFAVMAFVLLVVSEYVFLEPYVVGHIPNGTELGFVLIILVAILSAVVIPANVFRAVMVSHSRHRMRGSGGGVAGSVIGVVAGACSCGPLGLAVISTFGVAGATVTAFLASYEIPLRIAAVCILALVYVTTSKSLAAECRLEPKV